MWYDFAYDSSHNVQDNMDGTKFTCLMFTTITTFTISLGYFLIPLIMQPGAYQHFQDMIRCKPRQQTMESLREHSISENIANGGDDKSTQTGGSSGATSAETRTTTKESATGVDYMLRDSVKLSKQSTQRELFQTTTAVDPQQRNTIQSQKRYSLFEDLDFANLRGSVEDPRYDEELAKILRSSVGNELSAGTHLSCKSDASHHKYEEEVVEEIDDRRNNSNKQQWSAKEESGSAVMNVLYQATRASMASNRSRASYKSDVEDEENRGVELHNVRNE
jgi:hypothetical protein